MTNDHSSQSNNSVKNYIASFDDEQTVKDCQALIEMMQRISGHEPKMWNVGTIGFDTTTINTTAGAKATVILLVFIQEKVR